MKKHIVIESEDDSTGDPISWISKLYIDDTLARRTEFLTLDETLRDAKTFSIGGEKVKLSVKMDGHLLLEPASPD